MLTASSEKGIIWAFKVSKDDKPFFCPECSEEMILKRGEIKIHHFAHKVNTSCGYGAGESQEHLMAKYNMFVALDAKGIAARPEERFGDGISIADVAFSLKGYEMPIAVEIQRSYLSIETIYERTLRWASLDVPVIWVILPNEKDKVNYSLQTHFKHIYNDLSFIYNHDDVIDVWRGNKKLGTWSIADTKIFRIKELSIEKFLVWTLQEKYWVKKQ